MSKIYILVKELPDTAKGTKLFFQDGQYYYKTHTEQDRWFTKDLVEKNREWFCEEQDFIEMTIFEAGRELRGGEKMVLPHVYSDFQNYKTDPHYKLLKR